MESLFSQDKRRFGSQLSASSANGQFGELCLRLLTHNIALLFQRRNQAASNPLELYAFNGAGSTDFSVGTGQQSFNSNYNSTRCIKSRKLPIHFRTSDNRQAPQWANV